MPEAATQYIEVPMGDGLDTLTAPERLAQGKSLRHEDMSLHVPGALEQRRAHYALTKSTITSGTTADRTAGYSRLLKDPGGALLAIGYDDSRAYEYSEGNEDKWIAADLSAAFPVTRRIDVLRDLRAQHIDIARVTGWLMVVVSNKPYAAGTETTDTLDERVTLLIRESDRIVRDKQDAWPGQLPSTGVRMVALENRYFVAVWVHEANDRVRASFFDTEAIGAGWSAPVNVAITHTTAHYFDICVATNAVYVAYTTGDPLIGVEKLTIVAGAIVSTGTTLAGSAIGDRGVAIASDAAVTTLLVAAANSAAGVRAYTVSLTPALVATSLIDATYTNPIAMSALVYSDGGVNYGVLAYTGQGTHSSETYARTRAQRFPLSTFTPDSTESCNAVPRLKPFRYRGQNIFGLKREQQAEVETSSGKEQSTLYLVPFCSGDPDKVIGRMLPYTADEVLDRDDTYGRMTAIVAGANAGQYWTAAFESGGPYDLLLNRPGAVALFEIDFSHDSAARATEFDGELYVAGSVMRRYERDVICATSGSGTVRVARGFVGSVPFHSPAIAALETQVTGTGGLTPSGVYSYRFTHEYTTTDGRKVHSLPSPAISETIGVADDACQIQFANLGGETIKQGPSPGMRQGLAVAIWRSVANATEPIHYLAAYLEPGVVTHMDELADAILETREVLYTDQSLLPNEAAPPCLALAVWKDRLVALGSEHYDVWVSKTTVAGELAGWSGAIRVETNVHTSRPIFISSMGQALLVWWTDAIGVLEGEPPNDAGQGGTLRKPVILQRGIGLAERASVVETPLGTFFRSRRGIYLLGLDLSLNFIGAELSGIVQKLTRLETAPTEANTIRAAMYLHERAEARFYLRESEGETAGFADGATVLVYNLDRQQWHTHLLGTTDGDDLPIVEDAVALGEDCAVCWASEWVTGASFVWLEDAGSAADPASTGRPRPMLQSGWIDFAGPLSSPRCRKLWLLGTFPADTLLRIEYDYLETTSWVASSTVDVRTFGAGTSRQVVEFEVKQQNAMAFRLSLVGHERLVACRAEIEIERGTYRRRATRA